MGNVLKISDAASLALHSMTVMAQKEGELVSVKDIANTLGVSANHLSKVMQRLVKADLVKSIKGYGGGFKLNQAPEEVTFLEIYEAIDGKFKPSHCLLDKETCAQDCIMGDLLKSLNYQVENFFSNTKLSDFIK